MSNTTRIIDAAISNLIATNPTYWDNDLKRGTSKRQEGFEWILSNGFNLIEVSGPAQHHQGFDCIIVKAPCALEYVNIYTGETRLSHSYRTVLEVPEHLAGHDLCLYCGTDNGENGEYRMGYDCCMCGSN